jgi:penicillin-binding protein 1A
VHRLAWPLRFVAIILAGGLLLTGVVLGVAPRLWGIATAHSQVPVVLPDFQPLSERTVVYDTHKHIIAVFERENSQPVKLSEVPSDVISALLAVEDTEYYDHKGVNLRGFFRALLSNFASDAPTQGASTITQQVVKNEFLAGLPRDGRYKALQAHYAVMLEKRLTKAQILERYLNTVFFGNNAYGLQAAAEVYFGKPVQKLSLVEGAFLAGLVRSPSGYDPIRNPEPSRRRFKQVTERLSAVGLVGKAEAQRLAVAWPLPDRVRQLATTSTVPTYYTLALKDYLLTKSNILGATEQERANMLYRGGLTIYTTLDPAMQIQAEQARSILPNTPQGFDAAVVSLDTATGAIRAMVGGRGIRHDVPGGEVNMALVPRQTGSSIKAFILAAAYEAGAQPSDYFSGAVPCTVPDFVNGVQTTKTVRTGYAALGPLRGPNTWNSTDCGFVRLSYALGLHRVVGSVYRLARSPYFYEGQPASDRETFQPLPLTATGNNVMAPIDMASGMQTILNQGLHHEPYFVQAIDGPDGKRMYTHQDPGVQVLDTTAALDTIDTLKGVIRYGTGARNLSRFPRPAAGKTGTQNENTNSWFVGGTPQLTTAVWVGDPNGYTPMAGIPEFARDGTPRGTVQGADYPARIWGAYMEGSLASKPPLDWPAPPWPSRAPVRIYNPGEECLAKVVSGTPPPPPGASTTTTTTPPSTTTTTTPPAGGGKKPPVVKPPVVPPAVLQLLPSAAVIDDPTNPTGPLPTTDLTTYVYECQYPPANVSILPPH